MTKADTVDRQALTEQLLAVAALGREVLGEDGWKDIVPVSATDGFQVDTVADVLISHMPASPPLYPDGHLTDEPEAVMVAELIREAALEGVRDELPHSLAVVVDEIVPREGRPRGQAVPGRPGQPVRGTPVAEGHHHRQGRRPAPRGRHHARARRSRRCSAPGSTSTCT